MGSEIESQPCSQPVKVFVDTNVLISYLLAPEGNSGTTMAFQAGLDGKFVLFVSGEVVNELTRKVSGKPYLASRTDQGTLTSFVANVQVVARVLEPIDSLGVELSRDRKDDFVLLQAIAADVDVILTGDKDLLVLQRIGRIRIVNASDFLLVLQQESGGSSAS